MPNAEHTERKPLPPYMPYKTFVTFVDGLRAFTPSHIDHSVLGTYSGTMRSWLLNGLRYMKLVDEDDAPTERLRKLAQAEGEQRKPLLKELFETTYALLKAKGIDPSTTTPAKLEAAFAEFGGQGATVKKSVSFFTALAKDAGVALSPVLKRSARRTRGTNRPRRMPTNTIGAPRADLNGAATDTDRQASQTPEQALLALLNPETMSEEEQKAIWTLLLYLKKQER